MRAVFADTFYWVALTNPEDSGHAEALAFDSALADAMVVTTDEVLTEFATFYAGNPWLRRRAAVTVRHLIESSDVRVVSQSRAGFLAGLSLFEARPDKGYSFTDCISMRTMRQEGIVEVLTNDRHFEQEGFRALFRQ